MTMLNTSSSWHVGRATGKCAACGSELPPNTECWAALCDTPSPPPTPTAAATVAPAAPEKSKAKKEDPAPAQSPFLRLDFCEKCWSEGKRPENLPPPPSEEGAMPPSALEMFSFWKTTVPQPQQKKKLLVDDSVLMDVFSRMEGKTEPQEIRFRFVLALILMRKRLLKYEGMEENPKPAALPSQPGAASPPSAPPAPPGPPGPAPEVWKMLPRGENAKLTHVINPHLTAEQITEVSQQLSAILAEEV
jgi:hypothetical protein